MDIKETYNRMLKDGIEGRGDDLHETIGNNLESKRSLLFKSIHTYVKIYVSKLIYLL